MFAPLLSLLLVQRVVVKKMVQETKEQILRNGFAHDFKQNTKLSCCGREERQEEM
jgi:hypothetical protein